MNRAVRILLLEQDSERAFQVLKPMAERGYEIHRAANARKGLERIYQDKPDLILLARDLPDLDGLHFCSELKNDLVLRHIPVLLIDAQDLLEGELAAREAGADDYLSHPVDVDLLDGRIQQIFLRGVMGVNRHPVTGLPGFNAVYRKIQETLEKDSPFAICFLDINRFQSFNRRYGYLKGDEVLRVTARLVVQGLQSRGRLLDFLGHPGADDFVLITEPDGLQAFMEDLLERFDQSARQFYEPADLERGYFVLKERSGKEARCDLLFLSIAVITDDVGRPLHVARVQEQATELLSVAKRKGKSSWVRERRVDRPSAQQPTGAYRPAAGKGSSPWDGAAGGHPGGGSMEARAKCFQDILRDQTFQIHFQPIVHLDTGQVFGYEALLRGPAGTYFESPVTLFSMAREMELVLELDLLCLESFFKVAGRIPSDARLFFNVSPESLFSPMFRDFCRGGGAQVPAERIVLEVTRKRRILEFGRLRESAFFFKNLGYLLALDDAKSGTLSLQTVLELAPDFVKTDISVTRDIDRNPDKQRIFRRFLDFCRRNNLGLIAEGVESENEKHYLVSSGAKLAQGYLFAHPRPLES